MGFIADVKSEFGKLDFAKKTLRNFGITMAIVLGGIGTLIFFKASVAERAYWFWWPAGFFLISGLLLPIVLRPLYQVWMGLAFVMGWFVSRILLSILYYFMITPISIVVKWKQGDLLEQAIEKNRDSYWVMRTEKVAKEQYERLF